MVFLILLSTPILSCQSIYTSEPLVIEYLFNVVSDSIETSFVVTITTGYDGGENVFLIEKVRVLDFNVYIYVHGYSLKNLAKQVIVKILDNCFNKTPLFILRDSRYIVSTNYYQLSNYIVKTLCYNVSSGVEYRDANKGLLIAFSKKIHVVLEVGGKAVDLGVLTVYSQIHSIEPSNYVGELSTIKPPSIEKTRVIVVPVVLILLALTINTLVKWREYMI